MFIPTATSPSGEPEPYIPHAKLGSPVYVIDDDGDVRRSLHFLLSTIRLKSWPFASAQDFLDNLVDLAPAPVLLDIRMPKIDGLRLMSLLRDRGVDWPVIIMSAHGDIQMAVKATRLGAIEFLEKPFEFAALEASLRVAFAQLASVHGNLAARHAARAAFALLTAREQDIILALMKGGANKAVAHMLGLSVRTVEMHRANALRKLQVKSIAEVVRLAQVAELDPTTAADSYPVSPQ